MKIRIALMMTILSLACPNFAYSDDGLDNTPQPADKTTKEILTALQNLGLYLGNFNLNPGTAVTITPLNASTITNLSTKAIYGLLGTFPISNITSSNSSGGSSTETIPFIPGATDLNTYINQAFHSYQKPVDSYTNEKSVILTGLTKVNAIEGIDQPPYMDTPTNQSIQNFLSYLPKIKFSSSTQTQDMQTTLQNSIDCYHGHGDVACGVPPFWYLSRTGGAYLYDEKILPAPTKPDATPPSKTIQSIEELSNGTMNKLLIPSLSFDSMIGPVLYSQQTNIKQKSGDLPYKLGGLYGSNQATQADAFVRYATGTIVPFDKPSSALYSNLVKIVLGEKSMQPGAKQATIPTAKERLVAANKMNTYRLKLRAYAAQASVGTSNLYYLVAKRMPNPKLTTGSGDDAKQISQASMEFEMATHRLFKSNTSSKDEDAKPSWIDNLSAPTTTSKQVQEQIAILLAEINYRLYQNSIIQERQLGVMSVLQQQLLLTGRQAVSLAQSGSDATTSSLTK
jgi:hypothetical protein